MTVILTPVSKTDAGRTVLLRPVAKAWRGERGDKRNTKYAASVVGGGAVVPVLGAPVGGLVYHKYRQSEQSKKARATAIKAKKHKVKKADSRFFLSPSERKADRLQPNELGAAGLSLAASGVGGYHVGTGGTGTRHLIRAGRERVAARSLQRQSADYKAVAGQMAKRPQKALAHTRAVTRAVDAAADASEARMRSRALARIGGRKMLMGPGLIAAGTAGSIGLGVRRHQRANAQRKTEGLTPRSAWTGAPKKS